MHQHDERPRALVLHHQRLHDLMLGNAELARRFARAAMLDVIVNMLGERDAMLAQEGGGRSLADVVFLDHAIAR